MPPAVPATIAMAAVVFLTNVLVERKLVFIAGPLRRRC